MSIYRKPDRPYWLYDFYIKGHRFHGSTGTKNKRAAQDFEERLRRKIASGEQDKAEMSLDVAAERYWQEIAEGQASKRTTDYQLANLIAGFGKNTLLSKIGDDAIAHYVAQRKVETSQRKRRVSPATVNREVELLKRLLRRAGRVWKVAVYDIDWQAHHLQEAAPRDRVLSAEEEARLVEAAAPHLKAPIRFSLLTGVRLGNALNLDWSQIDLQAREITFRVKSRRPGGKVHVMPIGEALIVLLANQGPKETGPVFTYKSRKINSWRTAWEGAKRRAKVEDFRWHDLRHTVGTRVTRKHGIWVAKDYLGHEDIATTLRYAHHEMADKTRAMDALAGIESRSEDGSRHSPDAADSEAANELKDSA